MAYSQIRINKTEKLKEVLSALKQHFSLLSEAEIIKLALSTLHDDLTQTPMQTREEFLAELDAAEKDWEENGGYTLEEIKKLHTL